MLLFVVVGELDVEGSAVLIEVTKKALKSAVGFALNYISFLLFLIHITVSEVFKAPREGADGRSAFSPWLGKMPFWCVPSPPNKIFA